MKVKTTNISHSDLNTLNQVLFLNIRPFLSRKEYSEGLFHEYLERKVNLKKTYNELVASNKMNTGNFIEYSNLLIALSKRTSKGEILQAYRDILVNESVERFSRQIPPLVKELVVNKDFPPDKQHAILTQLDIPMNDIVTGFRRTCIRWTIENTTISKDGTFKGANKIDVLESEVLERAEHNLSHIITKLTDKEHFEKLRVGLDAKITKHMKQVKDRYIYKGYVPLPKSDISLADNNFRNGATLESNVNVRMVDIRFDAYTKMIKNLMSNISLGHLPLVTDERERTSRLFTLIENSNLPYKHQIKDSTNPIMVFTASILSTNTEEILEVQVSSMGIDIYYPTHRLGVRKNHSSYTNMKDFYDKLLTLPLDRNFLCYIVKKMALANDLRRSI